MIYVLILLVLSTAVSGNYSDCTRKCMKKLKTEHWHMIYQNDANGNAVNGSKQELLKAVVSGAHIRIGIDTDYFTDAQNVFIHGESDIVSAELLNHVSKGSWNTMQKKAYWWFVIVDTTGSYHMTRYYVGGNFLSTTPRSKTNVKWFVKRISCGDPVFSHDKIQIGSTKVLIDNVKNGQDVRVVSKVGHVTHALPMNNIHISSNTLYGQNVDSISKTINSNQLIFKANSYREFTKWSTQGTLETSGWDLKTHKNRSYSEQGITADWFTDANWEHVYSHTPNGNKLCGSLSVFKKAILEGKRVRFQLPDSSFYSVEADNLSIRNGHVTAQAIKLVGNVGSNTFDKKGVWEWLMVSTTGTVRITKFDVGKYVNRGTVVKKQAIKWFVDTQKWELAVEVNSAGHAVKGSKHTLINAIREGSPVRCLTNDGLYAFSAQNLAINQNTDVAAQTLNHISLLAVPNNAYEYMINTNAYWWFTIVDTTGRREMSRWNVGSHVSRGHTTDRKGHKWFVAK